ncbi:MAG: ABA4-like family protein [Ideonella sp.]|nr:ABA4-like family protein [Ideonella sp.]
MNPLDPDTAFGTGNALALASWIALALSPPSRRWTTAVWAATGWWIPLALGVAYVALIVAHWGPGGFGSLAEVRQLFEQPGLLAAGWLHYLAFDLFVGTWIARQGAERRIPHVLLLPCFALTFMFGPAGLLAFAALTLAYRRTTP